jgi:hypothetical protein
MAMLNKIKRKWKKFLETLADQNKSTYGEGGLNCCELKSVTENTTKRENNR